MFIVIPALEPDDRLLALVRGLTDAASESSPLRVLVIDDGSGSAYDAVFTEVGRLGATVLRSAQNRGKGRAVKTALAHARSLDPNALAVTADADGQHSVADILRIADRLRREPGALVLGTRSFGPDVPRRSRWGNRASAVVFGAVAGTPLSDTQTGLRGYSVEAITAVLEVRGERFEWEFRVLLDARRRGIRLVDVPIATIYLDQNASSHFRPVRDSLRVAAPLARFVVSAVAAFAIDAAALVALTALGWPLLSAVVAARLVSASVNFAVNRGLVFGARRGSLRAQAIQYVCLAVLLLAANFGFLTALTDVGVPLVIAKIVADGSLFFVSYRAQRTVVFASSDHGAGGGERAERVSAVDVSRDGRDPLVRRAGGVRERVDIEHDGTLVVDDELDVRRALGLTTPKDRLGAGGGRAGDDRRARDGHRATAGPTELHWS
nr:bifunctional glycosyltransferase family 2/GtrA family protein [Agromyces atrinae]